MKGILTQARFAKREHSDKGFGFAAALSLFFHVAAVALLAGMPGSPPLLREAAHDGIVRVSLVSTPAAVAEEAANGKREETPAAGKQARARRESMRAEKAEKPAVDAVEPDRISLLPDKDASSPDRRFGSPAGEGLQQEPQFVPVSHNSGGVFREGGGDAAPDSRGATMAMPRYRENSRPVYPAVARSRGYEGLVILSVEVFADGKVGDVKVAKTSGYSLLDRSALEAVKLWKFDPARKMGIPVAMRVKIPVRFSLKSGDIPY